MMPIRIQLWRGDTQIGRDQMAPSPDPETGHSLEADTRVDAMITAIHRGEHGDGPFRLECDHVDKRRVFLGSYYRCDTAYPQTRAVRVA